MESLIVTLAIYRNVFTRGALLSLRNWPVLGSVFAYVFLMEIGARIALQLGMAGGFLLAFVWAACIGSFLYLVEMIVRTGRVSLADFQRSFGAYLWDVVTVNFVVWIGARILGLAVANTPQAAVILLAANILVSVFFNAVPELIYLGHHSAMALLAESYNFISENWIEWFPANMLIFGCLLTLWSAPIGGNLLNLVRTAAVALLLYFAMVVRGLLFIELSGSSRRSRLFHHRAGT